MTCHIVICNKILWTQLKVKYIWFYIYSIIIYIMQKMIINNVSKYIYIYIYKIWKRRSTSIYTYPTIVALKANSKNSIMAVLKFFLCLFLVFAHFSSSETRPHSPFLNKSNRALMEIAKQVLKASVERQSGLMSLKPTRVY